MTPADLEILLDFNYWARDRVLEAVRPLTAEQYTRQIASSFPSVRETLVHVYSSEWVWYTRWQGTSPTDRPPVETWPDVPALEQAWRALEADIRAFVRGLGAEGVLEEIDYRLMSGQPGRSAYWEMIQHVVNHGTYHRGQITTMLRQMGAAPPASTDLITFHRLRGQ
jgi:uncharacterized damage-inducible protein DinB